jgi:hypothetical protein
LIKTFPCSNVRVLGGGIASAKSSRIALNVCPPATETNEAVNVPLKPNENVEGRSVVPPRVPVAMASAAEVGLGSPGSSQNGCTPQDTVPKFPRVAELLRISAALDMVNVEPVTRLVRGTQPASDTVHPVVTSGNVGKVAANGV